MKHLKTIWSLFWLGILLFALSGRTVHVFFEEGHEHEFVCAEESTHVHEKEHSCFICEFELQLSDDWNFVHVSEPYAIAVKQVHRISDEFVADRSKFNFTQRGPPVA